MFLERQFRLYLSSRYTNRWWSWWETRWTRYERRRLLFSKDVVIDDTQNCQLFAVNKIHVKMSVETDLVMPQDSGHDMIWQVYTVPRETVKCEKERERERSSSKCREGQTENVWPPDPGPGGQRSRRPSLKGRVASGSRYGRPIIVSVAGEALDTHFVGSMVGGMDCLDSAWLTCSLSFLCY